MLKYNVYKPLRRFGHCFAQPVDAPALALLFEN